MKKKTFISVMWISSIFLFFSCNSVRVIHTEATPEFSLSNYKTYNFYDVEIDADSVGDFNKRVDWVEDALQDEFKLRGLKLSEENPDLYVNIGVSVVGQTQTVETRFASDARGYAGGQNYAFTREEVAVQDYNEAIFVLHFVDTESTILVWEGIAQTVVAERDEDSKSNIAAGAKKLFKSLD